jgi:hypothetical protein
VKEILGSRTLEDYFGRGLGLLKTVMPEEEKEEEVAYTLIK